ncbi:6-bladed beta-propeller [Phocaeicola coprophilus]|uniref:6-bladed beta-propeller n=1 Tax=Phocaeicola coprophilus TaxID=387090 RepID=UPI0026594D48|nr:6-bladed beta-propeller [Phocaeicola coprophilus]
MKIFNILLLMGLTSLAAACSGNKTIEKDGVINVATHMQHLNQLCLEDIQSKEVSYVPLETTDSSLIGDRPYVRLLKNKILVSSQGQPLKMFDAQTGKFISTVGLIGQGKGEYNLISDMPVFWVDEKAERIMIKSSGQKILCFDSNGDFIENLTIPDEIILQLASQISSGGKLYFYFPTETSKISVYDLKTGQISETIFGYSEEKAIQNDYQGIPIIYNGYGNVPTCPFCIIRQLKNDGLFFHYKEDPVIWKFEGNTYLKERFNDTIYVASENKLESRLIFDLGSWHCPYEKRFDVDGCENRISIDYVLEGKKCLYFVFQTNYYNIGKTKNFYGVFDKQTHEVKISDTESILDNNKNICINKLQTATEDGTFLGLIPATEYNESASEEDNPVVVILK